MFELRERTKAKLLTCADKAIKAGQTETKPGVILRLSVKMTNEALNQFDASLLPLLYEKSTKPATQAGLEGIELPDLSRTGEKIDTIKWGEEQTGCSMLIDQGTGGRSDITLKDGTAKKYKIMLLPGAVTVEYSYHAGVDYLSAEQLGRLHLLHQHDVWITMIGPQVDQLQLAGDQVITGEVLTPEDALARTQH